jgi:hypothetical protein
VLSPAGDRLLLRAVEDGVFIRQVVRFDAQYAG